MLGTVHYALRSRLDGRYLIAQPNENDDTEGYLLLFKENYDARSYLNTFAPNLADRLTIESVPVARLKELLQRWGYRGVALVEDVLTPSFQFLELT